MMNNICTIYLIRHGQSEGNRDFGKWVNEIQYTVNGTHLTDEGKQQVRKLHEKLKDIRFDAIFSSHLHRAKETAEILATERKMAVIAKEALQERIKGKLGNKTPEELRKLMLDRYFFGNPNILTDEELWKWRAFPDMETAEESVERFRIELREIAIAYPGKTVMVVSHGHVMRMLLVKLGAGTLRELPSGAIINTGYIKLESDGVDFFVKEMVGVNKNIRYENYLKSR